MLMRLIVAFAAVLLCMGAAACATTLEQAKQRGFIVCGSNPGLPGFGLPDDKGNWDGLDVDFCRGVAAAIFDDVTKVKFFPLTGKDRFTALQSGEIDLLSRNTTWTLSREAGQGFLFTGIIYFDGQGFMVRKSKGIKSVHDLSGASICVQQGTTTELTMADFFNGNNLPYEPVDFATADEALSAYESGRCDAFTTDASSLYAERIKLEKPEDHVVLPEIISKEPLGPAVRQGDDQWFNIVKWTLFAMIDAEELGVTSKNVDEKLKSDAPEVRRLLGQEGNFGESLGLSTGWAYRVVKRVGNYGEVFDRNFGPNSLLKIERGLNRLWSQGGLLYAPPIR